MEDDLFVPTVGSSDEEDDIWCKISYLFNLRLIKFIGIVADQFRSCTESCHFPGAKRETGDKTDHNEAESSCGTAAGQS